MDGSIWLIWVGLGLGLGWVGFGLVWVGLGWFGLGLGWVWVGLGWVGWYGEGKVVCNAMRSLLAIF